MSDSCTIALAEFVEGLRYKDIPPEAIEAAKRAILDTIGVTMRGSREPVSKIMQQFIVKEQCKEEANIIGTRVRSSVANCAFCTGIFAHALDYDDVYYDLSGSTRIHASAPLIASCLGLSENIMAKGAAFIEAFVAGIEVIGAINRGLGSTHYVRGWHATSTVGALGAAATASKLLKLKKEEIQVAFGIATSLASGSRQNFGTMVKPIHVGNAARVGVLSAIFARDGITAEKEILDKPMGFAIFSEEGDWNPRKAIRSSEDPWAIIHPGLQIKRYPSCGGTHRALDALFHILHEERSLSLNDIVDISVIASRPPHALIHHRPISGLQGKFSMEYCITAGIFDGHIGINSFSDAAVLRREIQAFLDKIQLKTQQDLPSKTVRVEINCKKGVKLSDEVLHPIGSPPNPISWVDLEEKYRDCVGDLLASNDLERSLKGIKNFENLDSVNDMIKLFTRVET